MDVEEVARCAVLLERYNADRSYGNVLTLLGDLDKVTAEQLEQLETTDVVTCLHGLLKSCSDDGVKESARSLLSKWKRDAEASSRVSPQQEARGRSHADPAQTRDSQVASSSGTKGGSSASSVRSKCVQLLLAALGPDPPDRDKASDLAADVERRIHELHSSSQLRYKVCVRSKVANLRNPSNGHLRQGLLGGSLSPQAFARMSAEEMASAELRRLREEYSSRGVSERQLPRGTEGTRTQKIRCKRCGGSDCSVTQVSRGALFLPAWVRQSGPDEDAMTFVTCSGCGQQWYHSGWVCL